MKKQIATLIENRIALTWAMLVLLVGLVSCVALYIGLKERQINSFQSRVNDSAQRYVQSVQARLDNFGPSLAAARALFVGADRQQITLESFHNFNESLNLIEELHAPGGLGYAARVLNDQRKRYAEHIRATRSAQFPLAAPPQSPRDMLIIEFFEPEYLNARYLGQDLAANPKTFEAARNSVIRNQPVMSEPEVQTQTATPGIWSTLFMPVFNSVAALGTSEQRLSSYNGLVFVPINLEPVLEELALEAAGLQIQISATKPEKTFFSTVKLRPASALVRPYSGELNIYGNQWSFQVAADQSLEASLSDFDIWVPIGGAGLSTLLGAIGIGTLITSFARRRQAATARARLAAIVESVDDCIIGEDLNRRITSWNSSASKLFDLAEDDVMGKPFNQVIHLEAKIPATDKAASTANETTHKQAEAYTRIGPAGSRQSLLMGVSEVYDDKGILQGYARVIRDVTQQLIMETELRESQKMQAIGLLSGGLAHDFNNLLGIVLGNLDELQSRIEQTGLDAGHHLRAAQDAATRGSQVARSLLSVARQQSTDVALRDINEVLLELMPLLKSSAGASVTLLSQLSARPLVAVLDVSRFSNAILNLVINARDALVAAGGEKVITVRTSLLSAQDSAKVVGLRGSSHAVISVTDSGPGMTEAVRQRAFEPFFTTKQVGQGTGLGLPMVFGFAQQLGGKVTLENQMNSGLIASLYLPLNQHDRSAPRDMEASSERGAQAATDHTDVVVTAANSQNQTVLVVDDEIELLQLARQWIKDLGYRVFRASSPEEARSVMNSEKIDILFTDVVMPGTESGIDLANWARDRYPDTRILIASGYASDLKDGVEPPGPLIHKPYRKQELARFFQNASNGINRHGLENDR